MASFEWALYFSYIRLRWTFTPFCCFHNINEIWVRKTLSLVTSWHIKYGWCGNPLSKLNKAFTPSPTRESPIGFPLCVWSVNYSHFTIYQDGEGWDRNEKGALVERYYRNILQNQKVAVNNKNKIHTLQPNFYCHLASMYYK